MEMPVEGEEHSVVLQGYRGDPKIVYGDGSSFPAQIGKQAGIYVTGVFVGVPDGNPIRIENTLEYLFVFGAPFSHGKTSPKFGNDHERENDLVGPLNGIHGHPIVFAESDVGAGVD